MTHGDKNIAEDLFDPDRSPETDRQQARTIEQVRQTLADHIAHVLIRPSIYVGNAPLKAAIGLEHALRHLCSVWASIEDRYREFLDEVQSMHESTGYFEGLDEPHGGRRISLEEGYRKEHPEANEDEVIVFVARQWLDLANRLQIPLYDTPS